MNALKRKQAGLYLKLVERKQLDWKYGNPRTFQVEQFVGHADSLDHPNHFIAVNIGGKIEVAEMNTTSPKNDLPLKTFSVSVAVIPTEIKNFPATSAHGTLTLTNGSVITQMLPQGMIFSGKDIEVITDTPIPVPPGNASGLGYATVSAHTVISERQGNIAAFTINQVFGTSLFIRNLQAFTGGRMYIP